MKTIANHRADREELNQLINDYEDTMEDFRNNMEDILQNMNNAQQSTTQTLTFQSISFVEPIEVRSNIQAIKTFWNGMVEADNTAKNKFSAAQTGIQQLDRKITSFIQSIGKNGGNVGSLDIDKLHATLFADRKMLDFLQDKLNDGKNLTFAERELLYQYLQNGFFSEEDHALMNTISIFMGANNELLKDYINDEVLSSEAALEQEIQRLELYLFEGNLRPGDQYRSEDDRIKLHSYLDMLKNYRSAIQEIKIDMEWDQPIDEPLLARIEYLNFEFQDNPINAHTSSEITIDMHQDSRARGYTREEFLAIENIVGLRQNFSENEYYFGPDAVSDLHQKHRLDLEDKIDTYTGEFVATQLLSHALTGPASVAFSGLRTISSYQQGKDENEQRLTFKELEQTATDFKLELQVNTRNVPGSSKDMQVQLHPTNETFNLLERWEAVNQIDSDYPYPVDEIEQQNWAGMNEFLYEEGNKATYKLDEDDRQVYNYIIHGTQSDHPVVQEAMKN